MSFLVVGYAVLIVLLFGLIVALSALAPQWGQIHRKKKKIMMRPCFSDGNCRFYKKKVVELWVVSSIYPIVSHRRSLRRSGTGRGTRRIVPN